MTDTWQMTTWKEREKCECCGSLGKERLIAGAYHARLCLACVQALDSTIQQSTQMLEYCTAKAILDSSNLPFEQIPLIVRKERRRLNDLVQHIVELIAANATACEVGDKGIDSGVLFPNQPCPKCGEKGKTDERADNTE